MEVAVGSWYVAWSLRMSRRLHAPLGRCSRPTGLVVSVDRCPFAVGVLAAGSILFVVSWLGWSGSLIPCFVTCGYHCRRRKEGRRASSARSSGVCDLHRAPLPPVGAGREN